MKLTERTKFFESFGKTNFFYLTRYSALAQAGIYSFTITSKSKAGITVAVGDIEIFGKVLRGAAPTPPPTPKIVIDELALSRENWVARNAKFRIDD